MCEKLMSVKDTSCDSFTPLDAEEKKLWLTWARKIQMQLSTNGTILGCCWYDKDIKNVRRQKMVHNVCNYVTFKSSLPKY